MVCMAVFAQKGIFEEDDIRVFVPDEEPYERHYDDFTRNYEEAA